MLVSTLDAGPSFKSWADGLVLGVVVIVVVDDEASLLLPYWNSDCSGVKTHDDLPSAPEHDGIRLACTRASDLLQRVATREDICLSARPINWEFLLALLQRASESIIMFFCRLFSGCHYIWNCFAGTRPLLIKPILCKCDNSMWLPRGAVLARSACWTNYFVTMSPLQLNLPLLCIDLLLACYLANATCAIINIMTTLIFVILIVSRLHAFFLVAPVRSFLHVLLAVATISHFQHTPAVRSNDIYFNLLSRSAVILTWW